MTVGSGATASRSPGNGAMVDVFSFDIDSMVQPITVDSNAFVRSDNTILQNTENLLLNFPSEMDIPSRERPNVSKESEIVISTSFDSSQIDSVFPLTPESQSLDDFDAAISSLCSEGSPSSVIVGSGATSSRSPEQLNVFSFDIDSMVQPITVDSALKKSLPDVSLLTPTVSTLCPSALSSVLWYAGEGILVI